jgi:hypothetical protein
MKGSTRSGSGAEELHRVTFSRRIGDGSLSDAAVFKGIEKVLGFLLRQPENGFVGVAELTRQDQ